MIIKRFEEDLGYDEKRHAQRTTMWHLVTARRSELRKLKRLSPYLWRILWTAEDYRKKGKEPKGKLDWVSPEMTVEEVIDAYRWLTDWDK